MASKLGERPSQGPVVASDSRGAIVTALATVPGLSASPDMPDTPAAGTTWPVWMQTTPDGWLGGPQRDVYDVWALLPAGHTSATVQASDQLRRDIWAALWPICEVQISEPVNVRFDNQSQMPGLRLRVRMRGMTNDSSNG